MALAPDQIDKLLERERAKWSSRTGPPTYAFAASFARAIESAACAERDKQLAERDARIAELTAERDEWKHEAMNGGNAQYLREKVAELERQLAEARNQALEDAANEAEHWQTISTTPGHACGQYIGGAIRAMKEQT